MQDLEEHCLSLLSFTPPSLARYVDILKAIPEDDINGILKVLNSYHDRLQFTHEEEINGNINFLELSIPNHKGHLIGT